MGTEVEPIPAAGEDQEEGEIIDVEAYENNDFLELESISRYFFCPFTTTYAYYAKS